MPKIVTNTSAVNRTVDTQLCKLRGTFERICVLSGTTAITSN